MPTSWSCSCSSARRTRSSSSSRGRQGATRSPRGTSSTLWLDSEIKSSPISSDSYQKSSQSSFYVKSYVFKIVENVISLLGYFCSNICHQEVEKSPNLVTPVIKHVSIWSTFWLFRPVWPYWAILGVGDKFYCKVAQIFDDYCTFWLFWPVWPDWPIFKKLLATTFLTKVGQILDDF